MEKPSVSDVLKLVHAYYANGNGAGGNLHIVLDDGNIRDGDVLFCLERAKECGDTDGIEIANLLLAMSKTQRKKVCRNVYNTDASL